MLSNRFYKSELRERPHVFKGGITRMIDLFFEDNSLQQPLINGEITILITSDAESECTPIL